MTPEQAEAKAREMIRPWLDAYDIGDVMRNDISFALATPIAAALIAAAADEREACAKVAENVTTDYLSWHNDEIAAAIRLRGSEGAPRARGEK